MGWNNSDDMLPLWHVWKALYGNDTSVPEQRYTGAAGMFNTWANALEFHLRHDVNAPAVGQVPWEKHRMPYVKGNHVRVVFYVRCCFC